MRTGLGRDRNTATTRLTQQANASGGTDMLAMNGVTGFLGKQDVSGNNQILGKCRPSGKPQSRAPLTLVHYPVRTECRLLAVIHDRQSELSGILHGTPHHSVVLDTPTVVCQSHHPGGSQGTDRRHFLPGDTLGDGSGTEDIHACSRGRTLLDPSNGSRTISHGRRIGHANNRGESTRGSTTGSGCDGLLVGLSRFTEMDMDVD